MSSTAIGIGIVGGLIAALLIIRYVERQHTKRVVSVNGFDLPVSASKN